MIDTTIKKVNADHSPKGEMGQKYLVSGKTVSMRLWEAEPEVGKAPRRREYETVGYVISGAAELHLEGQTVAPGGGRFLAGAEGRRAQLRDPRALHRG